MKVKTVALSDIQLVDELYPRQKVDYLYVVRLQDAVRAGVTLPPLRCDQHLRLIDGRHRYEAYRKLGVEKVEVVIEPVQSEAEFFQKAVEANITHGRMFSPYDLTSIALRLHEDFHYDLPTIAQLLRMPTERLENWLQRRVAVSADLYKVPLKYPFLHYGGQPITPEVEQINQRSRGMRWLQALGELRRQLMDEALRQSVLAFLAEAPLARQELEAFAKTLLSLVHQAKHSQAKGKKSSRSKQTRQPALARSGRRT